MKNQQVHGMTVSPSCTAAARLRGRQPTAGCALGRVGTPWGGPQHAESGLTTGEQGGLAAPSLVCRLEFR